MSEDIAVEYHEATESAGVERVPFAHLSVEAGHLYLRQLADLGLVRDQFAAVLPRVALAVEEARAAHGKDARISTCLMIDDYNTNPTDPRPSPAVALAMLNEAMRETGLRIDYVARESGCVDASSMFYPDSRSRVPLAEIVLGLITPEPIEGSNGSGSSPLLSGWVSNGRRSEDVGAAMEAIEWRQPEEYGNHGHSVLIDAELYNDRVAAVPEPGGGKRIERVWSCSMLTAVWHLLRLGMLRNDGRRVAVPCDISAATSLPRTWEELPTVIKVNPAAAPFCAYRAVSILPSSASITEVAADVVMNHISLVDEAFELATKAAAAEPYPYSISSNCSHRIRREYLWD
ncbi:SCO2522 family protein [Actinospica robiniae]|uniref:SCO2522 family protein n=1 Tax=Actinospica robiniae TaxID=304901 RepID=UPI000421A327|nr:SCO2522 family protein [Actinospica robiniae]